MSVLNSITPNRAGAPLTKPLAEAMAPSCHPLAKARAMGVQFLYQNEFSKAPDIMQLQKMWGEFCKQAGFNPKAASPRKAFKLCQGVWEHRQEINTWLERYCDNWSLERLSLIDVSILRLGVFELLWTSTPRGAVINAALELGKEFSDSKSPGFINGVLDRIKAPPKA